MLLYGTPLALKAGKYRVHKVIDLHGCRVDSDSRKGYEEIPVGTAEEAGLTDGVDMHTADATALMHFSFTVRSPQKSFVMVANDVADAEAWVGAIRGVITVLMADEIDI